MSTADQAPLEDRLRNIFSEVFARPFLGTDHTVDTVEEWDSLSHIKLVINLERAFQTRIDPTSIARLYSSFADILQFIREQHG